MTHDEFRQAYHEGRVRVTIDPARAARFVSARLLLPLAVLPLLGTGVALALIGWILTGLAIVAAGIVVPRLIKRGAPRFILVQSLSDGRFYEDVVREDVLIVTAC